MDYYYEIQPISHLESVETSLTELVEKEKTKQLAFQAMSELEGWCTEYKASVLIDLVYGAKAKTLVEIGVWGGKSLVPMAFALKSLNAGKIYGIDPWSSLESAEGMQDAHKEWWSAVNHEIIYQGLVQKISKFALGPYIELVRCTSESAPAIAEIDILHIDGNHSEKTSLYDVGKWVPLVKSGGLIVFDDTTWGTTNKAVDWLNANCIKLADFHEDNDWGIWVKP
jgi:predicted O-methyltransferase YrrM